MEFEDVDAEFEDVDARIEWEAQRVAAAFGVVEFATHIKQEVANADQRAFDGSLPKELCDVVECHGKNPAGVLIEWKLRMTDAQLLKVSVDEEYHGLTLYREPTKRTRSGWESNLLIFEERHLSIMVQGLYLLGAKETWVIARTNCPLSAHEKMELRLSMPSEFWPKKWVDEEERE